MAQQQRGQCSGESAIVPHDLANARYPCPPTNATTHPLKSPAPSALEPPPLTVCELVRRAARARIARAEIRRLVRRASRK